MSGRARQHALPADGASAWAGLLLLPAPGTPLLRATAPCPALPCPGLPAGADEGAALLDAQLSMQLSRIFSQVRCEGGP